MEWKPIVLEREHSGEPGSASPLFRELAIEAQKLMAETYKQIYDEDFHISEIVLKSNTDCHVYYKVDEKEPFFSMSRSQAVIKKDPLTEKERGYVNIECRVPVRDN